MVFPGTTLTGNGEFCSDSDFRVYEFRAQSVKEYRCRYGPQGRGPKPPTSNFDAQKLTFLGPVYFFHIFCLTLLGILFP